MLQLRLETLNTSLAWKRRQQTSRILVAGGQLCAVISSVWQIIATLKEKMRIPIQFAWPSFSSLRWLQLHWPEQQQFAEGSGNFRSLQSPSGTDPPCHQSPSVHAEMWVWQQHLQRLCRENTRLSQTCWPGKLALRMLLWHVTHGLMLLWAHSPLSWHPQKPWLAVTSQQTVKTKQHTENVSTWFCNLREDGEKTILKYVFQFIVSKQTQLVGLPSDRQIFVTLLLFYSVSSRHLSIVGMQ